MALSYSGLPKSHLLRQGYSGTKGVKKLVRDFKTENLVQIPGAYFPHALHTGSLWVEMQPVELLNVNTGGNRGGSYRTGAEGPVYRFLAPDDGVQEVHNYDWEEYESMSTKLLNTINTIEAGTKQIKQIASQTVNQMKRSYDQWASGKGLASISPKDFIANAVGVTKPKFKIDSPLAFKTSHRRQFTLTFNLLSEGFTDLTKHVKKIQAYAAPESTDRFSIKYPHIWKVHSNPTGVLDIDIAACTSCQVNWMRPYFRGKPQRCELTLSFTDISPLFASTIKEGGIVNVTSTGRETSFSSSDADKEFNKNLPPGVPPRGGI